MELLEENPSGELLRDVLGEGDLLGLERFAGDGTCQYSARTASDVILYGVAAPLFESTVERYPAVRRYLAANFSVCGTLGFNRNSWLEAEAPSLEFLRARLAVLSPGATTKDAAAVLAGSRSGVVALVDARRAAEGDDYGGRPLSCACRPGVRRRAPVPAHPRLAPAHSHRDPRNGAGAPGPAGDHRGRHERQPPGGDAHCVRTGDVLRLRSRAYSRRDPARRLRRGDRAAGAAGHRNGAGRSGAAARCRRLLPHRDRSGGRTCRCLHPPGGRRRSGGGNRDGESASLLDDVRRVGARRSAGARAAHHRGDLRRCRRRLPPRGQHLFRGAGRRDGGAAPRLRSSRRRAGLARRRAAEHAPLGMEAIVQRDHPQPSRATTCMPDDPSSTCRRSPATLRFSGSCRITSCSSCAITRPQFRCWPTTRWRICLP